ncbi:efflux RND transporter periplasmic adaptor subunit [Colwellia sp. D2M02]|uniref:efflux RND transporter periplasmic adaptor subunit n=1 Tax=Colwellia sp. D2M02 TaxID=2841562 RepID=UPI001C0927A3|nr:efflux RND transporter periplasmic adaptor subunit [Colwellia sp. D2M02]MBU2892086.1 efflux RND transporter periplasmic adaptor subunit [Colwellia sp. D2M02]
MAASASSSLTFIIAFWAISQTALAMSSGDQLTDNSQKVTVAQASSLLFYPEKKATALVSSINHAKVPAQIAAQVLSVNVQLGSSVNQGQVLVNLDCQDKTIYLAKQKSQLATTQAQLQLAKRNFERSVQLKKDGHIGEAELDESEIKVTVTQEQVNQVIQEKKSAELAVQRCQVVAPFNGMVTERMVNEGDYVNTGDPLVKVLEQDNLEIAAQIPIDQMKSLAQAGAYYFINNESKYPINIKHVVNFVASNSRSQVVTFTISPKEHEAILAGMNGMVSWQSKRSYLPAHLLTQRHGQYGIFVVTKKAGTEVNTAKFIALPNAQEGRPFELVLDNNQTVIVDGRHRVNDGMAVTFNNAKQQLK